MNGANPSRERFRAAAMLRLAMRTLCAIGGAVVNVPVVLVDAIERVANGKQTEAR
jgi:hypothetical protein